LEKSIVRRWRLKKPDPHLVNLLAEEMKIPLLHAAMLVNRGIITEEQAAEFLSPTLSKLSDPFLMKGVEQAVERIVRAKKCGETVCIHGDYDVDGVTAVVVLTAFFRAVSIPVCYLIPRRMAEGYGLSREGVDEAKRLGVKVLVTVDCGITSVAEADYCRESGIDLIITDHHTPGDVIPDALAVVNPLQPGCNAPFKKLSGVGIAFKLAVAVRSRLRQECCFENSPEPNLKQYLDLVALGTIADLVPLTGENRTIVNYGLQELAATGRIGISALKKVADVKAEVSTVDVGFRLAPRLNAAGRLDDAKRGVELLLTSDTELAAHLAEELDAANRERQEIEKEILADALDRLKSDESLKGRTAVVLASDKWHPGVIGIVASRVVERCHRPTILIALQDGEGKGSGRSIPAFHLYNALAASAEPLVKFGGHQQAAGISILEQNITAFYDLFDRYAAENLTAEDLIPEYSVDAEIAPEDLGDKLLLIMDSMKPYGMGNPEPLFLLRGVKVVNHRLIKESHLKMSLDINGSIVASIGFNMAGKMPVPESLDILFTPELNVWKGREILQLRLRDIRAAGGTDGTE